MELGNFLDKLKGSDKEEPKKFLALILTDEVVQAAVWNVAHGQTDIVALGTPVEWDGDTGTTTELITAVDATISSAVEGLENEPNNVILGIPHSWTDKNGILGVKKEFISKIRKELELEAIGYVVITDSILSYLKMQEGTPTTSIILQVSRDELTLALVRLGRIEAIETIGRSDDVVEDVVEGITRFKIVDNLPSRIILFNSMHNLDDIIQNLLSIDWLAEFNFLHVPKIEALPKDVAIRALVIAGGSEIAKSLGLAVSDSVPAASTPILASSDQNFISTKPDPIGDSASEPNLLSAEEIGFTEPTKPSKVDFIDPDDEPDTESVALTPGVKGAHTPGVLKHSFVFPKIKLPTFHFPKIKLNLKSSKPVWWYLGGGLITLCLLIFYLIWVMPSAVITVRVTPKILEEDVELTLSSKESSIDFAGRIVPAGIESLSASGEKIGETTGTKIVGDPAKGKVTIYNRTTATKTFAKGSTLSSGSLKFTLDEEVSVASKSAGSDYVDVPGKATVSVTASAIGKEGNLSSGTEFSVLSFGKDSYVGKNDESLAGGSSEEVRVVGKDDQKQLVKELTEELLLELSSQAIENSQPGTGVYLIPDSSVVDSVTYSAKTGETATSLTASLTLKSSLLKYKTDDVTTLVNSSIDQAIPSGYIRANLPSTVDLTASSISEDETTVKGNAKVKVSLLPVIDNAKLQTLLKGKSVSILENNLKSTIPGYLTAEVKILPKWIPTRLKGVPRNPSSIHLQIVPAL